MSFVRRNKQKLEWIYLQKIKYQVYATFYNMPIDQKCIQFICSYALRIVFILRTALLELSLLHFESNVHENVYLL